MAWFRALLSGNAHEPIAGLQKQSKKPFNKHLINLERSVFTGKSQTETLPKRGRYGNTKV